jgi:ABC-type Zn uptake system ZnuABC Zn-binding protein ZnuA
MRRGLLALVFVVAAASAATAQGSPHGAAGSDRLKVVASFSILGCAMSAVAASR